MNILGPIRHNAAYEVVAEHIRRALQLGRYLPGDKLPAERALAVQLGVSRTVLREALRALEGEGLLVARRGAAGGVIVKSRELAPGELRSIITARFEELEQLYEFRIVNEGAAARLAAKRRSRNDLAVIAAALQRMDEILAELGERNDAEVAARFTSADSAFHRGIAEASRNRYLSDAVEETWVRRFWPIGNVFSKLDPSASEGHRQIYQAIEAGDGGAAEAAMTEHIGHTLETLRAYFRSQGAT